VVIKQGSQAPEVVKLTGLTRRQLDHGEKTIFVRPGLALAGGWGEAPQENVDSFASASDRRRYGKRKVRQ
jgi:hypothetical protein